jgi:hypothetical protein
MGGYSYFEKKFKKSFGWYDIFVLPLGWGLGMVVIVCSSFIGYQYTSIEKKFII